MSKRRSLAAVGALVATVVGTTAYAAGTADAQTGGVVHIYVTPGGGAVDRILLTGAIGDYGKAISVDQSGQKDANGSFVKIVLQHGGFTVDATKLNAKLNKMQPNLDKATCSLWETATSAVSLSKGNGAYETISGSPRITVSFALVLPRFRSGHRKGQCNFSNSAVPLSQFESITGVGRIAYNP